MIDLTGSLVYSRSCWNRSNGATAELDAIAAEERRSTRKEPPSNVRFRAWGRNLASLRSDHEKIAVGHHIDICSYIKIFIDPDILSFPVWTHKRIKRSL